VALALVASVAVTGLLVHRLVGHGVGAAAGAPALFVVLGWLGQSVTAVDHLGARSTVLYGLPVLAAALAWLVGAAVVVARARPSFSLAWWSFTFPLGTVVTGTSALAATTGSPALRVLAGALFALLLAAWVVVATRTLHSVVRGLGRAGAGAQDSSTEGVRTGSGSPASIAAGSPAGSSASACVSAR
jgi:tellurite resistance protein TehA-like permease